MYGDPHMVIYKKNEPVTCSAFSRRTYLANEFFILEGVATAAAPGSQATYVTEVCSPSIFCHPKICLNHAAVNTEFAVCQIGHIKINFSDKLSIY